MNKKQSEDVLILKDYVKQLMEAKQISFKELAEALNVNYKTLYGNLDRSIGYKNYYENNRILRRRFKLRSKFANQKRR